MSGDTQIIRARIAYWPGERYACAWPMDPDEEERFWLLDQQGQIVATFRRYRLGRFPRPRGARR